MSQKRPYKIYELYKGNRKVYIGITYDASRREKEHDKDKTYDKMKIASSLSTEKRARELEAEKLKTYMQGHKGILPKYNSQL